MRIIMIKLSGNLHFSMKAPTKQTNTPIIPPKQHVYLDGPKSRGSELKFAWRVFTQFLRSARILHFVGPCITVFGSARFKEDDEYYQQARSLGRRIAQMGFTTMTGGGPGIMEAATRELLKAVECPSAAISSFLLNKRKILTSTSRSPLST